MKKRMEERFITEMDAYIDGRMKVHSTANPEYNGLLEMGKALAEKDFSSESNKEAVYQKVLGNNSGTERSKNMKKPIKYRRLAFAASFALVCILSVSLMTTSYAQEWLGKVLNIISLGNITVVQTEEPKAQPLPDPKAAKAPEINPDQGSVLGIANGQVIIQPKNQKGTDENKMVLKSTEGLDQYTSFHVKIPGYLPEGYQFDRAELFKDEKGIPSPKYINLFFANKETGKTMLMQQRLADGETSFTATSQNAIEKVKVNGADAVLAADGNIDWESDQVLYMLYTGDVSKDDLMKTAESLK